ncbi:hypothetical protein [Pelagibaculum spongiae]|uniref:Uncharacterized protein n=1 Tax=Pelagibaculum spongiae TaxID=2080658 RepID=A0A2V1GZ58_9GAMM|nr:hypothetical protein [Pelagibaculum spongiae]PVZ71729.1 hypothetical protein DC094_01500 [Pelagibaculum spongiae]
MKNNHSPMLSNKKFRLAAGLPLMLCASLANAEIITTSETHVFSVSDIQGGENFATYADDKTVLCGMPDSSKPTCPTDVQQPKADKDNHTLYPIESNFGFNVSDFVGAADRTFDQNYKEGFAGNIVDPDHGAGVAIANVATNVFKVKDPYGTWCSGLGGKMVKCSSEHYVVMEHVLTCNETIPYSTKDPLGGMQKDLIDPETKLKVGSCADAKLDNQLYLVRNGIVTEEALTSTTPGDQMIANESTVRDDIAVGKDYSITLKDDGKPLYRWGNAVKRPVDIRLYAKMPLPQAWKENPETVYRITSASLSVVHSITNNPNDQIRPEDMENEAAIGRLPESEFSGDNIISAKDCYEGDGDFIAEGTLFKNAEFANQTAFSDDLKHGLTNAWYTSTNRGPFEVGEESATRWRLRPNKYGQDIPGLEIANAEAECVQAPPFSKHTQKYTVGDIVTTTINLLDSEDISPLLTSSGWIDASQNNVNIGMASNSVEDGNGTSINYLPLTEDFDLAIYVKGDKKAIQLYSATLKIEWDDQN